MARLQRRRFSESTDVRDTPGGGRIEVVELDDRVVAKITWPPGWRWSTDMRTAIGTQYCEAHHVGVSLTGRLRVQLPDGIEIEYGPGDIFQIPAGHDAWVVGDEPYVSIDFEALRGFAKSEEGGSRRALASVLMTDVVDSTAKAVDLGSARWLDLIARHNELSERTIARFGGRLIKTTGDGVIGLFDSAEQAVRAALAIEGSVSGLDITIRAAVHVGEVELTAGDVRGVVVHTVARMLSLGDGGDVILSTTVRDTLDGTGIQLDDFGTHELKGLPGARQLYRVRA